MDSKDSNYSNDSAVHASFMMFMRSTSFQVVDFDHFGHFGQAMARDIGALDYIECSALSGAGVDDIIDGAMWAFVMDAQTERGKKRTL